MGDVQGELESAPSASAGSRRVSSVAVWGLVVLIAAAAFAAAVVYAGGVTGVEDMVGSLMAGGPTAPAAGPRPTASVAATASADATASAALGGLPAAALERMFAEQLESQASIGALVDGQLDAMVLGTPVATSQEATIPVTVKLHGGGDIHGRITLHRYHGLWYFFSLGSTASDAAPHESLETSYDPAVVRVITQQQATAANQSALVDGVLGGGFKTLKFTGVRKGAGTASVGITFAGGTDKPRTGRFVCITKQYSSTQYWFIARLEAN